MNILIAPNSMKGSINAFNFADAVEEAFLSVSNQFKIVKIPVADGGDFTGEVLQRSMNAKTKMHNVIGPLGEKVQSKFSFTGNIAIIEMADASGMKLVDSGKLNPMRASSYGTGQLISNALKQGCIEIFLAIGGSATVDGGMGMMAALGFQFFDNNGKNLNGNGENLQKIRRIKRSEISANFSIKIICDVENPLLGENGAAEVFGPQKGATPEMVAELEKGLKNWNEIIQKETGKKLSQMNGTGAAGGISIPLMAFFNAEIVKGADFVLSKLNFEEHVKWADIVITGEGKIDDQTFNNKAPFAVAQIAKKYNKPLFVIAGISDFESKKPFDHIYTLVNDTTDKASAIKNAEKYIYQLTQKIAQSILSGELKI